MIKMNPATKPIAKAVPARDGGFLAQFAMPGTVPAFYEGDGGRPIVFPSEGAARQAAYEGFFKLFSSRVFDTRKAGGYQRMSAVDLSRALVESGITPTLFAELYGVPQSRVIKWLDAEQDIPHSAAVFAKAMMIKPFLDLARDMIERHRVRE